MSGILWVIIVGFVAGIIARLVSPGPNNPERIHPDHRAGYRRCVPGDLHRSGHRPLRAEPGRGFITATIGALVVLFIWHRLVASRVISDPGVK